MSCDNLFSVDQDYSSSASPPYGPTSGRVGASPATAQAGRVALAYDGNNLLAPIRLDAAGNLRTSPAAPSGGPVYVYSGQTPPAAAAQYGQQVMAQQNLPTPQYLPLTLDPAGALFVQPKPSPTWRFVVPNINGGSAKNVFSLFNGSASSVVRIQQVNLQTPYIYTTGGTVVGLSKQANQSVVMLHEMRRISAQSKSNATTTIAAVAADNVDTLDSGIVAMSNANVSGAASAPFHRADANSPSGLPWYLRGDIHQKTLTLRPADGCVITSVTDTTNYNFDLEIVVTVLSA